MPRKTNTFIIMAIVNNIDVIYDFFMRKKKTFNLPKASFLTSWSTLSINTLVN